MHRASPNAEMSEQTLPSTQPTAPSWSRRLRLWCYHRLYHELSGLYDLVSRVVSLGEWHTWRQMALDYAEGERILEVGFGTGELLLGATGRCLNVVGLERSAEMQRLAAAKLRRTGRPAPQVQGDVQSMPFASACFATILATFPAEFILDPQTWDELHRVLRPGGQLAVVGIVVRLHHPLVRLLARILPGGKPARTWEQCLELAAAAGFEVTVDERQARWSSVPVLIARRRPA